MLLAVTTVAHKIPAIEELSQLQSQFEDELRVKRFFFGGGDKNEDDQSSKNDQSEESDQSNDDDDEKIRFEEILSKFFRLLEIIINILKGFIGLPTINLIGGNEDAKS